MARYGEHVDSVKAGVFLWFFATIILTVFSLITFIKSRKEGSAPGWISRWDSVINDTHQILTLAILVMLPVSYYIPAVIGTYFLWFACGILLMKPEIFPEAFRNYAVVGIIGGLSMFLWLSIWTTDYTH